MKLGDSLAAVSSRDWTNDTDQFLKALPNDWIRDSLVATAKQSIRNRKLPGHVVSWLVVGMALFRTESIMAVMQKFDLLTLVKTKAGAQPQDAPSSAAVVQARGRLGYQPLEDLFRRSASRWAKKNNVTNEWQGLQPYYIDNASIKVAESEKNAEVFGRAASTGEEKGAPQIHMVAVVSLNSDLLADAVVVGSNQDQTAPTHEMIDRLGPKTVLLAGSQYVSVPQLVEIQRRGEDRHWISLADDSVASTTKQELSPTDKIIEVQLGTAAAAPPIAAPVEQTETPAVNESLPMMAAETPAVATEVAQAATESPMIAAEISAETTDAPAMLAETEQAPAEAPAMTEIAPAMVDIAPVAEEIAPAAESIAPVVADAPTPEPAAVEPTPEPAAVEPTPEPVAVEPTPAPAVVEPTPEPAAAPLALPAHIAATSVILREVTVFDGKETTRIWTSLADTDKYSATEIAGLFRTQQEKLNEQELSGAKFAPEFTRSKKPDHALQEIWGLAIAYNLTKLIKPRAGKLRKKKDA